jgi:predicted peptidase
VRRLLARISFALVLALAAPAHGQDEGQREGRLRSTATRDVDLGYLLFLPRGYGREPGKRWPMIVYLHGGSMRGADPAKLRTGGGLPRLVDDDPAFPFIVLSPQIAAGRLWTDDTALMALLDDVGARYAVDADRVYLTGHSVGGNGAWYMAYLHPERFAAVVPMSAPANPWWATRLARTPVWAFHGDRDTLVAPRESREMVEAISKEGGDARLSVLRGRDHFILDQYENRAIYHWMLRHRRPARR